VAERDHQDDDGVTERVIRRPRHRQGWGLSSRRRLTPKRKIALSIVLVLLAGALAFRGSYAAWVVADTNTSSLATNTITLSDNQGGSAGFVATSTGTALFTISNLEPGSAATTQCMGVNFAGTAVASTLTLQATVTGSATLAGQLTVNTAQYNTTGTVSGTTNAGSCTNYPSTGTNTTVGTQGATLTAWSTASPYSIASPVTSTWYKFTVSGLPSADTSCATYCGLSVTVALTWTLTTT